MAGISNAQKITPFLWFNDNAAEAVDFYVSVFKNSSITGGVGKGKDAITVSFVIEGANFTALNGGPHYQFNPSISFVVHCEDQPEVDYYWDKLLEGGKPMQCGWLTDKFGVSWQIVPDGMIPLLTDPDPARAKRAMDAMMQMIKLDIGVVEAAANGE